MDSVRQADNVARLQVFFMEMSINTLISMYYDLIDSGFYVPNGKTEAIKSMIRCTKIPILNLDDSVIKNCLATHLALQLNGIYE